MIIDELKEIKRLKKQMANELLGLMREKKIGTMYLAKAIETTPPTLNRAIDGKNDDLLAKALVFCRNHPPKDKL